MQPESLHRIARSVGEAAAAHPLDVVVALLSRYSKQFSDGWGDEELFTGISGRVSRSDPPHEIDIQWQPGRVQRGTMRCDGSFASPLTALAAEAATVHLRAWVRDSHKTACVILAGSRDQGYAARERIFGSLLAQGLDLYLLENPFYGKRRKAGGLSRITVSDHGLMALGMVLEARALLNHLRPGYEKLVVAGYSMGGHMAALTAAVTPFPVACAALATGASAGRVYSRGLLSWSVDLAGLSGEGDLREATLQRLQKLFDAADITRYPPPLRPDAALIAGCTRDGYILRQETERLHRHWPGSTLRWMTAGHFSALMTCRRALCECISTAASRL